MRRYVNLCVVGAAVAALAGAAGPPLAAAASPPLATAAAPPVRHVVIIYLENHSFDNVLGFWCDVHRARCPRERRNSGANDAKIDVPAHSTSPLLPYAETASGRPHAGRVSPP